MLLELDLIPGTSLGPFVLGMPLSEAVKHIQGHKREFRCVELKYADQAILDHDLILNLPEHGVHLRFEAVSQRLRLIEIYDNSRIQLRYGKGLLGGASHAATAMLVYNLLGPTTPGQLDTKTRLYPVHYPGLLFLFPVPAHHTQRFSRNWGEVPLEFPDKTTPVASRICIYAGQAESAKKVASIHPPPLPRTSLYGETITAVLHMGLTFNGGQRVEFGDSPQDVCSELGSPTRTALKVPDRPSSLGKRKPVIAADYFFRYPSRGLDILFDGVTHKAKKFVLHTNAPGHPEFNTYTKCNFSIQLAPEESHQADQMPFSEQESVSSEEQSQVAVPMSPSAHSVHASASTEASEEQSSDWMKSPEPAHSKSNRLISKPVKQSPRWQDTSPRDILTGVYHEFFSGTSDSSRASESQRISSSTSNSERSKRSQPAGPLAAKPALDLGGLWDWGSEPADAKRLPSQDSQQETDAWQQTESKNLGIALDNQFFPSTQQNEDTQTEISGDQRDGWEDSDLDDAVLNLASDLQSVKVDDSVVGDEPETARALDLVNERSQTSTNPVLPNLQLPQDNNPSESSANVATHAQQFESAITCNSRFQDVQAVLKQAGLAESHHRGLGCADPYARTIVHGYRGVAFEVMRNGYLASVTLFEC